MNEVNTTNVTSGAAHHVSLRSVARNRRTFRPPAISVALIEKPFRSALLRPMAGQFKRSLREGLLHVDERNFYASARGRKVEHPGLFPGCLGVVRGNQDPHRVLRRRRGFLGVTLAAVRGRLEAVLEAGPL